MQTQYRLFTDTLIMPGQVPPTQFDLNFTLFGVPIRVHPIFWLTSAFLAWEGDQPVLTLIQMLCIFLAIVVHEMGHALITARYGWRPEIVLYFFGGYATTMRHSTWKDIAVTAAGPAAGFLLLFVLCSPFLFLGATRAVSSGEFGQFGLELAYFFVDPGWFVKRQFEQQPDIFRPLATLMGAQAFLICFRALLFSIFINYAWNVLNLIPVLPLDGGQISRELFLRFGGRNGMENCIKLSMLASGAIALLAFQRYSQQRGLFGLDPWFLGLMFGYLCFQNFQSLQNRNGYW